MQKLDDDFDVSHYSQSFHCIDTPGVVNDQQVRGHLSSYLPSMTSHHPLHCLSHRFSFLSPPASPITNPQTRITENNFNLDPTPSSHPPPHSNTFQHIPTPSNTFQHLPTHSNTFQHLLTPSNTFQNLPSTLADH